MYEDDKQQTNINLDDSPWRVEVIIITYFFSLTTFLQQHNHSFSVTYRWRKAIENDYIMFITSHKYLYHFCIPAVTFEHFVQMSALGTMSTSAL